MREFIQRCLNPKHLERPSFADIIEQLDELEQELV
jgi:hypothetical protein